MSVRLLIIDDEPAISASLSSFMEDHDFEVRSCDSAEDGLAVLASESFDVAIVDLRLPGMNGENFIVEAHQIQPTLKFLIHTGSMVYQPDARLTALGFKATDVYHKPVADLHILVEAVINLSGGSR